MSDADPKLLSVPEEAPLLEASPEEKLKKEIDSLRSELEQLRDKEKKKAPDKPERPRSRTLWMIGAALVVVLVAAFFLGWLPYRSREKRIREEAKTEKHALPQVNYVLASMSSKDEELLLPGTTEALVDAPVLARADGFISRRLVDIGDHVKKGQLLAVIAAPEVDQQVVQARAQVSQSEAALKQAGANLQQGRANEALAQVTASRYDVLVRRGAVSRQDNDTQQATYQAQVANLEALNQAVSAATDNVSSARANLQRLLDLQSFERVTAPFDGIVTLRNTEVGALITNGSTLLFRISQVDRLRTYINVPQPNAPSVKVGQKAELISPEFGAKQVIGTVTRTAEALDSATRTLLTEVQVENAKRDLRAGMFVQVNLKNLRTNPPVLVPGDALITGTNGAQLAIIRDARPVPPQQVEQEQKQREQAGETGGEKANRKSKDKDGSKKGGSETKGQANKSNDPAGEGGDQNGGRKPKQVVAGTIHLQPVQVGRDYGAAIEILSGISAGDRVIVNPNDDVNENVRVEGILTKANLDVQNGAPGAKQPNASSEKLQPAPSGERPSKQPSKTNKSRGPGY